MKIALVFVFLCFAFAENIFGLLTTKAIGDGGRIVGGTEITIEDAPYQASMQYFGFHICGGAIISKNYIITAAHCTVNGLNPEYYSVRVGSSSQLSDGDIHNVRGVYPHPFFSVNTFDFDVALLLLNTSIALDGITKQIISMPFFAQPIWTGTQVVVSGWGETKNISISNNMLRAVTLTVTNQRECNQKYQTEGGVTWRMICAFGVDKDSCAGDSGGPMVRISDRKLVGLVSFGPGNECAHPTIPGVYTRISFVRIWIRLMAKV